MGLLDIFRRTASTQLASPFAESSQLEAITLEHLYAASEDQLPITRQAAMSIPSLARARNVLVGLASRLPLQAMTAEGACPDQPWICKQPESGTPRSITVSWTVDQLIFYGRAWWVVRVRDWQQRPSIISLVDNSQIDLDSAGYPAGVNGKPIPASEFIRIDAPHEGILTFGKRTIRDTLALTRAISNAAANPVPSVELHQNSQQPTLTREQKQQIVSEWAAARRKSGIAFTPFNLDVKTHGQQAEQLLTEARRAASLDIARLMSVPAWVVDASVEGSSLNYSNVESRTRELIDYGLAPYLAAIEERLSLDDVLPRGTWARFDTNLITRGDLKTRAEAYQAAQAAGILTQDDCKTLETGRPAE